VLLDDYLPPVTDPCLPSPCGPNSQCRKINNVAVCSCVPSYIGSPPNCRPECTISSDCALDKSCISLKCKDPCPGTCGFNARCQVINHSPICSCMSGYVGDPFVRCVVEESKKLLETFSSLFPILPLKLCHHRNSSNR
jgi:hypothetical protein